jgi:hypothetical protein
VRDARALADDDLRRRVDLNSLPRRAAVTNASMIVASALSPTRTDIGAATNAVSPGADEYQQQRFAELAPPAMSTTPVGRAAVFRASTASSSRPSARSRAAAVYRCRGPTTRAPSSICRLNARNARPRSAADEHDALRVDPGKRSQSRATSATHARRLARPSGSAFMTLRRSVHYARCADAQSQRQSA